jgi:hypothetical protein
MPKVAPRPKIVGLIAKRDACELLNISEDSFERHWQGVFTDMRPADKRGRGSDRTVFADELAAACAAGGGVLQRAKAAVYQARRLMGRNGEV